MFAKIKHLALLAIAGSFASTAFAETPIIEFHTQIYENNGAENAFHFTIGATEDIYLDVDCGFGMTELEVSQAVFDPETGSIKGTNFTGSVNSEGTVRIYGDASKIDYLDFNGLYIDKLDISQLTNLVILDLSNNQITGLDLSPLTKLEALYIDDNPFSESPLIVGKNKPYLTILQMSIIDNLDPEFNFSDYPELRSAICWNNPSLKRADISGCPELLQFSIDVTNVEKLDVSKNPKLMILNIAETKITEIDLSNNPYLTEFYCGHNGANNTEYKIKELDLSHNPNIIRLAAESNDLTSIDISKLTKLQSLYLQNNKLTALNIDNNLDLFNVDIMNNNMPLSAIPAPRINFTEYYYSQRPFPTNSSYPAGATIDFSKMALRSGSVTSAVLYGVNRENPGVATAIEESLYKWDSTTGILTLNQSYADSVYVSFTNPDLPDAVFTSEKFMIKEASEFGKPSATAVINFSALASKPTLGVGITGASPENPKTFYVDFGTGNLEEFTATGTDLPLTPNASGSRKGAVTIYVDDDSYLTALSIDGLRVTAINLSNATALSQLAITNCNLPTIDLSWNSRLAYLDLSGNQLTSLDLTSANGSLDKTSLYYLKAANNKLASFNYQNPTFLTLDLSNNNFEEFSLLKMSALLDVNLSGNRLETADLRDCEALETADLSNNYLAEIVIPEYVPLKKLDITNNSFTFSALPAPGTIDSYVYAPQRPVTIPDKAPVISLFNYLKSADGSVTEYNWRMASDNSDIASGNIRENEGRFFFTNPDLGTIYCAMTNPQFPDFSGENALRTTNVATAPMPTHVFATLTPEADGTCALSFAGKTNGTTVYVDWTGEGDFEQLILKTGYQLFQGNVMAGKQAKFYSYDEDEGLTVFSVTSDKLTQVDGSAMKNLVLFGLYGSQIGNENLILPESPALDQLSLTSADLTSADFLKNYTSLTTLNLTGNNLETLDVSMLPKLTDLYAGSCAISGVTLDNPELFTVDLSLNQLESIDFSKASNIQQLSLSHNNFSEINVDVLTKLRALYLDNNKFTFATLPLPKAQYIVYNFYNQALMNIELVDDKVDLSSQAEINGNATTYRWFIDSPYLDDNNELAGEELYEGTEYTIENGVTTFLSNLNNVICVMTNPVFPELYLLTDFIDIRVSGVENVSVDGDITISAANGTISVSAPEGTPVSVYTANGTCAGTAVGNAEFSGLHSGIYIVSAGKRTAKVAIR